MPKSCFLVGTGNLSVAEMKANSLVLARVFGFQLLEYGFSDSPKEVLNSLLLGDYFHLFLGDAAMLHPEGGCWLESLGNWRQPTILFAKPLQNGQISGEVSGYVALCREFSVPLVGIVQLGGVWDFAQRRLDNLPWCGLLSNGQVSDFEEQVNQDTDTYIVYENIKSKMKVI